MEQNTENLFSELQVDQEITGYLGETARWAKFLSIVGFIFCVMIAILAFFIGAVYTSAFERMGTTSSIGSAASVMITVIYLVAAVVYFFPCLYLFRFSTKMQIAFRTHDQAHLGQSFRNLKSCFKFVGILTIISLAFLVLALILGIIAGSAFRQISAG